MLAQQQQQGQHPRNNIPRINSIYEWQQSTAAAVRTGQPPTHTLFIPAKYCRAMHAAAASHYSILHSQQVAVPAFAGDFVLQPRQQRSAATCCDDDACEHAQGASAARGPAAVRVGGPLGVIREWITWATLIRWVVGSRWLLMCSDWEAEHRKRPGLQAYSSRQQSAALVCDCTAGTRASGSTSGWTSGSHT
jgi:hypothetical protein